jgi:hypothetical protein
MKGHWILRAGEEVWGRDGWSTYRTPTTFRTRDDAERAKQCLDTDKDVHLVHVKSEG